MIIDEVGSMSMNKSAEGKTILETVREGTSSKIQEQIHGRGEFHVSWDDKKLCTFLYLYHLIPGTQGIEITLCGNSEH